MDLRILSTIERIKEGLFECIKDKPFRLITNNDIIKKAEISSRTFYRYYKDKNDLLDKIEDGIISELNKKLASVNFDAKQSLDLRNITTDIMVAVLQFSNDNMTALKILLSENGDLSFWYKYKHAINDKFEETIKANFGKDYFASARNKLVFDSFIGSKIVFIIDWLNCTDTVSIQDAKKMLEASTISLN